MGCATGLLLAGATLGSVGTTAGSAAALSEYHAVRIPDPTPPGQRAGTVDTPWSSRNWSGYAITGATYTSVSASWTVPTVFPPARTRARQFSSTWVGIDGFNLGDDNLIQAGTEQDWIDGSASYDAWWEILPAFETRIDSITVHPGDVMTVSITKGTPKWTIVVDDKTTGQSFSQQEKYSAPLTSAEWIQEAPTVGNHIAALADDGTVTFDNLTANGADPELTTDDSGVMAKKRGRVVISTPSSPNATQDGFAVAFGSTAPSPPAG
ncbi:MAG: G1 family glutamic endopeptidase [Acidimicrobiales bacterium]